MNKRSIYDGVMSLKTSNPLVERRFGYIVYSNELMKDSYEALSKIYSRIIPLKIEFDYATQVFVVCAASQDFDQIAEGERVPFYNTLIKQVQRKIGPPAIYITFKKEEE